MKKVIFIFILLLAAFLFTSCSCGYMLVGPDTPPPTYGPQHGYYIGPYAAPLPKHPIYRPLTAKHRQQYNIPPSRQGRR